MSPQYDRSPRRSLLTPCSEARETNWRFFQKEDGYAPRPQDIDLAEAAGSVRKMEEVVAAVRDRSPPVGEALRYVYYLYLKHVNSA